MKRKPHTKLKRVQESISRTLFLWNKGFTIRFINRAAPFNFISANLTSFLILITLGSCDEGDACPNVGAPVCSSDGSTYGNSCYSEAEGVENYTSRECADDVACRADYDPVCGSDGNTYGNSCKVGKAGIENYKSAACWLVWSIRLYISNFLNLHLLRVEIIFYP